MEKLTEDKKKNKTQCFKEERVEVSIKLECSGIATLRVCATERKKRKAAASLTHPT